MELELVRVTFRDDKLVEKENVVPASAAVMAVAKAVRSVAAV
jgi:hypothetical protein